MMDGRAHTRGLHVPSPTFVQRTRPLGLKLDVSNIGVVLKVLEDSDTR